MSLDLIIIAEEHIFEGDFLKPDEIAIGVKDDKIISLTDSSFDRLLQAYGFRYFNSLINTRHGDGIHIYVDDNGNSIALEYNPTVMSMYDESSGIKLEISVIAVDPMVDLYEFKSGGSEKIDLRKCLEIYPKNTFSKALEKITLKVISNLRKPFTYTV